MKNENEIVYKHLDKIFLKDDNSNFVKKFVSKYDYMIDKYFDYSKNSSNYVLKRDLCLKDYLQLLASLYHYKIYVIVLDKSINDIIYKGFNEKKHFKKQIKEFKGNKNIEILLLWNK